VFPSPKDQDQDVGFPVDVSLKWTLNGALPFVLLAVKLATGSTAAAAVPLDIATAIHVSAIISKYFLEIFKFHPPPNYSQINKIYIIDTLKFTFQINKLLGKKTEKTKYFK